jgi:MFS family permease
MLVKTGYYQPPLPVGTESTPFVFHCNGETEIYTTALTMGDIDCSDSCWADNCTVAYCSALTKGESKASVIMSIPYIISAVLSPFVGLAVDLYGFRAVIAALAPAMIVVVHLLLGYSKVDPVGPLVGQGLAYTGFASVLWPAVPLVVDDSLVGLAFGVVTSLQNLSCAIIPLIVASIYTDSGDKYVCAAAFWYCWTCRDGAVYASVGTSQTWSCCSRVLVSPAL